MIVVRMLLFVGALLFPLAACGATPGSRRVLSERKLKLREDQKLHSAKHWYGRAVAADGGTLVIGACECRRDDKAGAVYVYRRSKSSKAGDGGGEFVLEATLSGGEPGDKFGYSVSVRGPTIAVGAPGNRYLASAASCGNFYIFRRDDNGQWKQEFKFNHQPTRGPSDCKSAYHVGFSVAADTHTVVAGVPYFEDGNYWDDQFFGFAYVYGRRRGRWVRKRTLEPDGRDGHGRKDFGWSVAVGEGAYLVGAPKKWYDGQGQQEFTGKAYLFLPSGKVAKLPDDAEGGWGAHQEPSNWALFGNSVALSGTTVGVGCTDDAEARSGAVYVFRRNQQRVKKSQKLLLSDGFDLQRFGYHVAINGNAMVIGTANASGKEVRGSAYLFEREGPYSIWKLTAKFEPTDGKDGDRFGTSVGIDGDDTAVVGSWKGGSAYVYSFPTKRRVLLKCTRTSRCTEPTPPMENSDLFCHYSMGICQGVKLNPRRCYRRHVKKGRSDIVLTTAVCPLRTRGHPKNGGKNTRKLQCTKTSHCNHGMFCTFEGVCQYIGQEGKKCYKRIVRSNPSRLIFDTRPCPKTRKRNKRGSTRELL